MNKAFYAPLFAIAAMMAGCVHDSHTCNDVLVRQLLDEVNKAPGMVGIAFVADSDTVVINNGVRYPMMSVFKMHEALAVCDAIGRSGASLDSTISVSASDIDPNTWSPMLKVYGDGGFDVTVKELVCYAIVSSDNNASNILFSHVVSPAETDAYIRSIASDTTFSISFSEAEMKRDHNLSYRNFSSPLSACLLIRQIFSCGMDSVPDIDIIRDALTTVTTGQDRLGAAVAETEGVLFAHKTGSGYRNASGELIAHNDVAYVRLPDGRDYGLAVMIRDFDGDESEASALMARISRIVYDDFAGQTTTNAGL